ncbi:DUF6348 family protein [Amycolatopsis australiensis]|uniref:Uncharacterized protein n=1 Tax=Amycolatopsis australiensis TaxID=546364 RepID=A0A1K1RLY7_9PSEU|nr:DUF6348 family protein [Amycolatopsis australiensis]SFW73283.1 hypothetical protein SAMN04489730_3587 [Amycolatopsis australiensis]
MNGTPGWDAAVEIGIAAFCEDVHSPSDDEVVARLTGAGVEAWLADRLLYFLPMAYVRRLLPDIAFKDTLLTPSRRVRLETEPVFAAALTRAQRADGDELERIALRSSEASAVAKLVDRGAKPETLVLTETALTEDLEPVRRGDGGVPSPAAAFEEVLREHGVRAGRLAKSGARIDARIVVHPSRPGVVLAQVDFSLAHPALAVPALVATLPGNGATWREAIGQAVYKFATSALHPLVDGLLKPGSGHGCVDQDRCDHPTGPFDLVSSTQLMLPRGRSAPDLWPSVDGLLDALRAESLTPQVHGLGVYLLYQDGQVQTTEVLLDNEPWPAGEAAAAAGPAPVPDGEVTVRIFGLLVPVNENARAGRRQRPTLVRWARARRDDVDPR